MEHFRAMIDKTEMNFEQISKSQNTPLPEITPQDLSGKVVIVTGANVGIGYETAKSIASMKPAKLILACRNVEKGQEALAKIKEATGISHIEIWELDLASFASVKSFAKKFNTTGLALDLLVSNAGIAHTEWIVTDDGYEITTQVNHLSNALLVLLLTPSLLKSASPRVVVVASDVHFWAMAPKQSDPHPLKSFLTKPDPLPMFYLYPGTKLLNVLFAQEYARRGPSKVWIGSANPGYTESQLGNKDVKTGDSKPRHFDNGLKKRSTYEGAKSIIVAAIDPHVGKSGCFVSDMHDHRTNSVTHGKAGQEFAERVWHETVEILKKHLEEGGVVESWVTK
jgi:retinol dehydrogenase-12